MESLSQLIDLVKNDNNMVAKIKIAERLYQMGGYDDEDIVKYWVGKNFFDDIASTGHKEFDRMMEVAEEIYELQWEVAEYNKYMEVK